jgi:hypothetical protein
MVKTGSSAAHSMVFPQNTRISLPGKGGRGFEGALELKYRNWDGCSREKIKKTREW